LVIESEEPVREERGRGGMPQQPVITLKKMYLYASTPTKIMRLHKVTVSPCRQGGEEWRGRREIQCEEAAVICF
jgi:hypothetical protein